jgi:hypothetical protein
MITREITECNSVPELETVFIEHSSSFSYINAAAAITKYAKLRGSSIRSPFFGNLAAVWLKVLPEMDAQGGSNVLWACGKLGSAQHPVWAETWQAFIECVAKNLSADQAAGVKPQALSNAMYACAKLRKQPQPDELLLLVEAFAHPDMLAAANPQDTANVIWSLGLLSVTPGWQANANEELTRSCCNGCWLHSCWRQ